MLWVLLFLAIALAGLITVAAFAVWLWRKATGLFAELGMLGTRAGELAELAAQIRLPGVADEPRTHPLDDPLEV